MQGEEDDAQTSSQITFKPSFVLIAIDVHSSMFQTRENEDGSVTHPFKDALTACYEVADSLILVASRKSWNQFGVVLAQEDQKAGFIEFQNNVLESVKFLKKECALSNEELQAKYERGNDLDLAGFFLLCKKKFREIKAAYYKRTLIFITNDENPIKGDAQRKFAALNEAKTFEASDITFELVTMKTEFDYTIFYNELFSLYSKAPPDDQICEDKDGLVEKLMSSVLFRYRRMKYKFYPFKNDFERYLSVLKMSFISRAKLWNTNKASRDGKLLKRVYESKSIDTQISHQYTLKMGRKNPPLKLDLKDRYDIFGNNLPLGFHLQYVSPRQSEFGVCGAKTSLLCVDPREELQYFEQFWQYCVTNDKVLVCIRKVRHPEKIRYVELIPKFANNTKMFLVKNIPYCNELKWPKIQEITELPPLDVTDAQKRCVQALVDQLTFEYDPRMLPNPSYGKKKAYVKAKLLDEPMEEVNNVAVDVEEMDNQIRDVVNEIKANFHLDNNPAKGKKRKAPTKGAPRGRKVTKSFF